MAFRYKPHLDAGTMDDIIPAEFIHAFLIRNPENTAPSLYNLLHPEGAVFQSLCREGVAFTQQYKKYEKFNRKESQKFGGKILTLYVFLPGKYKNRPPSEVMPQASWVEIEQVYNWVVETKGYKPFILDADDLQSDPGKVFLPILIIQQFQTMV